MEGGIKMNEFDVYEEVWIMNNNTPTKMIVFAVIHSMNYWKNGIEIHYRLVRSKIGAGWGNNEGIRVKGDGMFPTKESLLNSL